MAITERFNCTYYDYEYGASISNDDSDVNKNGKKRFKLVRKQLYTASPFVCISLSSLHYYNVKTSNFTFCGGCEHKTKTFFFFSKTLIQPVRIHLQKKLPTFDKLNDME